MRRAEGGAKNVGIFRVKNHDFTPKNHIFSDCGGRCEIFGVFRVKNHDFTPKNHIFSNFRGGARRLELPCIPEEFVFFNSFTRNQINSRCIRWCLTLVGLYTFTVISRTQPVDVIFHVMLTNAHVSRKHCIRHHNFPPVNKL